MVFGVGTRVFNSLLGTMVITGIQESWEWTGSMVSGWTGLLWMVWLLVMISSMDVLYGVWYGWSDGNMKRLILLLLFFTLGMLEIILSGDLVVLFLGWEMIGVASFLLIGYYGGSRVESVSASMKALLYNVLGDIGVLFSLVLVLSWYGSSHLGLFVMDGMNGCGLGVILGGWCKSALFGMHGWLLDAMEGPTPVSALLHSATLVTAGALCLWKLSGLWLGHGGLVWFLFVLSSVSIFYASLHALWLLDLKRVVASSTCLHLAVSFMGMAGGQMVLVLEYLLHHGVIKALLFFMVGMVIHACSSQDTRGFGSSSGLVILFSLSLLTVTGVVGSGLGFVKDLLLMNGLLALSLLGAVLFLFAQLYSVLLMTSLDLQVSSRYDSSLGMLCVFLSMLSFSVSLGCWESSLVLEWFDLGFFPYVLLLLVSLGVSKAVFLSRLVLLGSVWFQRSLVESLGSSMLTVLLPLLPSSLHHAFLVFPLMSFSSLGVFLVEVFGGRKVGCSKEVVKETSNGRSKCSQKTQRGQEDPKKGSRDEENTVVKESHVRRSPKTA